MNMNDQHVLILLPNLSASALGFSLVVKADGREPVRRDAPAARTHSLPLDYHRSPPVSTYRKGTSGMRPKIPHASFPPSLKSGRSVTRSIHMRTTATGCRKQTRISNSFFII